ETLFRTKRLHGFVGHLASFFALIPFRSWKWVHGKHHRWTGWQDLDPTTVALVPRQLGRRERALVNVCWKYWIPIFSILYRVSNYWDLRRLRALFPHARTWRALAWSVALLLGAYAALGYLVGLAELARLAGLGLLLS